MGYQVIFGTSVLDGEAPAVKNPIINFSGLALRGENAFKLNDDILSRHVLLLGGSGCGKTNTFCYALRDIRRTMSENDIAIVFDTKGDYYKRFPRRGDYVIGNSAAFRTESYTWNIFDEVFADGKDETCIDMNAREISSDLFRGRGSSSQPFFCNAARDIFRGMLLHFIRQAKKHPEEWGHRLNNYDLVQAFDQFEPDDYIKVFSSYSDLRGLVCYFGDGSSNQALGVFGELRSMLSDYFAGIFQEHKPNRSLSMRGAVRQRGAKVIFIEYDLAVGETLTPMYRLLVDQALKEVLGRSGGAGKLYLIADEFSLLPKLKHIDDALNFGRSLGVRVIAGIQSINQLYDVYGRDKGAVVASGFGSLFAFHTNDSTSRDYISEHFGSNVIIYDYKDSYRNKIDYQQRSGSTVEEWDQLELGLGQAVIGLGGCKPFLFSFDEYKSKE